MYERRAGGALLYGAECKQTIDLEIELLCEKNVGRRRELMGELNELWDTALERGSEG